MYLRELKATGTGIGANHFEMLSESVGQPWERATSSAPLWIRQGYIKLGLSGTHLLRVQGEHFRSAGSHPAGIAAPGCLPVPGSPSTRYKCACGSPPPSTPPQPAIPVGIRREPMLGETSTYRSVVRRSLRSFSPRKRPSLSKSFDPDRFGGVAPHPLSGYGGKNTTGM